MIVQGPAAWRGRRPAPLAAVSGRAWLVIGLACAGFWLAVFAVAASDISGHPVKSPPAWAVKVLGGQL